ncbi:MAG: hypothetical protein H0X31_16885 [Nostocaceae cyanobacterium]|nr:hypothetical protein [Nostocaceae cyanobacterium]
MIISELEYCESITESTSAQLEKGNRIFLTHTVKGGAGSSTAAYISVLAGSVGKFTQTFVETKTVALALPNGGSLALGIGVGLALAYTPPSH